MEKIMMNAVFSLGLLEIVFAVLDWYNPYMNFQGNTFGKIITVILAALCVVYGITELLPAKRKTVKQ